MKIRQQIHDFIISNFHGADGNAIDDDVSLLEGIVDSMGVLEVVDYLEDAFGITVEESEVLPENFGSIGALAAYVSWKLR